MKTIMRILILLVLFLIFSAPLFLLFSGCSTPPQTIVKTEYIKVPVPVIQDTLSAVKDTSSNNISAYKIVKGDTVIRVVYMDKDKKIYIRVKPDTVTVPHIDTVKWVQVKEVKEETPWIKTIGYGSIITVIFLFLFWKLKK